MQGAFVIAELASREVDVLEQPVVTVSAHDLGPGVSRDKRSAASFQ